MDGDQAIIKPHYLSHSHLRRGICAVMTAVALLAGSATAADPPPTFRVQGESRPISSRGLSNVRIIRPKAQLQKVNPNTVRNFTLNTPRIHLIQRTETAIETPDSEDEDEEVDPENAVPSLNHRPTRTVDEILDTRGDITFRKTPLSEVVFMLSELWHINIVASENITGEVSGAFRDTPLREVLSAALTAGGYSYEWHVVNS